MASNRKSESFSPLEVLLPDGSANNDFNSCTGVTGLVVVGVRGSGLVDLSTLGRPVDPVEGIIRSKAKSRGRDRD
jgi:hypothetical protein